MLRTSIVRLLRVILPLAALALLSVLFLLARKPAPQPAIPYARGGVEELSRSPGIGTPEFTTVTPDGAQVTLRAARAVPAGDDTGTAQDVTLDWRFRDGLLMLVMAPAARFQGDRLTLDGGVRMTLSSGWEMTAPELQAGIKADDLLAPRSVAVSAPFGELEAGAMRLAPGRGQGRVLELNGGVRLLYRP